MAVCEKCGYNVPDGSQFCPACGAEVKPAEEEPKTNQNNSQTNIFGQNLEDFTNTADSTNEYDPADIEKNKSIALLSYLGFLFFIPLVAAPNSKFARFHANQGLILFICEVIWSIAYGIINAILSLLFLGFIARIIGIISVVFLIFMVLGIVNCVNGKAKELPIIGRFHILK